ncbi:hypothetical protein BaRGS_00012931 [Batillaria attramentaria]|uniref:Uncharacterized protein n=1 Tax=Batillaria attramentaria TaxID=370345 RepID=A0ABD0L8R0_9CAEN
MAMGPAPGASDYLPSLPLDLPVPRSALRRRDGVSFCSTSSYITAPRLGVSHPLCYFPLSVSLKLYQLSRVLTSTRRFIATQPSLS